MGSGSSSLPIASVASVGSETYSPLLPAPPRSIFSCFFSGCSQDVALVDVALGLVPISHYFYCTSLLIPPFKMKLLVKG